MIQTDRKFCSLDLFSRSRCRTKTTTKTKGSKYWLRTMNYYLPFQFWEKQPNKRFQFHYASRRRVCICIQIQQNRTQEKRYLDLPSLTATPIQNKTLNTVWSNVVDQCILVGWIHRNTYKGKHHLRGVTYISHSPLPDPKSFPSTRSSLQKQKRKYCRWCLLQLGGGEGTPK